MICFHCVVCTLWVVMSIIQCAAENNDNAFKPNSAHVNIRFGEAADVNKTVSGISSSRPVSDTTTAGGGGSSRDSAFDNIQNNVDVDVELATSYKHTFENVKSRNELALDQDIPIIVWWTKWLNHHDKPHIIQCGEMHCYTTRNRTWMHSPQTRAVFLYGTDLQAEDLPLPRLPNHQWALFHEESPLNNFMLVHSHFISLINYTATFRRESDFPLSTQNIPYISYLTERKPVLTSTKNSLMEEDGLASILYVQSHCDVASDRDRYVNELMKYIKVDSYGECLKNKQLPSDLRDPVESMDSPAFLDFIARYKFHLAFENAICNDYMTEKLFRPLHIGSVPIYMGSPKAKDWMPDDHSVIFTTDFASPKELANYIQILNSNDEVYENYLKFKSDGIQNKYLIQHMKNRSWGNEQSNGKNIDFISGFECFVCNAVSNIYNKDMKGKEMDTHRKVASRDHLHCPQPYPSVGDINDLTPNDSWKKMSWIEDYWTGFDKARAVSKMVHSHENDPSKFEEYWMNIINK